MNFADLKSKVSSGAAAGAAKVAEGSNKIKEASTNAAKSVVETTLSEVNGLKPILANSGFIVGDILLTVSVPPAVSIVIEQVEGGKQPLDCILENEDLTKFQRSLLVSIKQLYALNATVEKFNHTIGQIEVEMGLPPVLRAHLNSMDSRAFSTSEKSTDDALSIADNSEVEQA
jgi:hypothetical protein